MSAADDGDDDRGMPVASPSFILAGSSRGFPRDVQTTDENLHQPKDVQGIFEDVNPGETRWVELIKKMLKDDCLANDVITQREICSLCLEANQVLSIEPSLLTVSVPEDRSLVIVGDVHGQFADLVHHILAQQAPKRSFLFLGDYVDRGPQSVEVIVLLLALKVTYPSHVFLLRGNHEDSQTSRIYGFFSETSQKFRDEGVDVWHEINEVFCHLPVAALVKGSNDKRFFCAHGGLSPELVSVAKIADIDRVDYGVTLDNDSTSIMDGLMWSDPVNDATLQRFRPNERGCGYVFGPLATQDFCQSNNIALIIRAHQLAMEGYSWSHSDQCLTVFSAPNYCGLSNNLGAVIIADDKLDMKFVQYRSAPSKAHVGPPAPMSLPAFFRF